MERYGNLRDGRKMFMMGNERSVIIEDFVEKVDEKVVLNRHFTI